MRLRGSLVVAAALASLAGASPAGAVVLGNPDMNYETSDFGTACGAPGPTCVFLQTKLPGATLTAPFTGVIRKWNFAVAGSYPGRLVVLRKGKHGRFSVVRTTQTELPLSAGSHTFETQLRIKEGDHIAFEGSQIIGRNNADAVWKTINPAPLPGESGKPGSPIPDELLFNAKLKR